MKVLFDYQTFTIQKYGGISRYFANLHYGINSQSGLESKIGLLFTDNAYLDNAQFPARAFNDYIKKPSRRFKCNKWYCKLLLQKNNFDIFHPTFYHPYFLKSLKKPFVLTVHDMIYELFPQYFETEPYKLYKGKLIERADHIIAISECTKMDIQKFYNVPDSKMSVIHHGYQMQGGVEKADSITIDGKYILFVGDRYGYKNFALFIEAAAPVIFKYSIKLICAGGGGFTSTELELLKRLNLINHVKQLNVTDEQLKHLYKQAVAFVYPSLYEGFGLPVLEAFFNNCPVILSNTSSLPEVGGDAAEYFDPADAQSIASAIEQVISNDWKQKELKVKGEARLQLFNFEDSLKKTLQVYSLLT